MECLYQMRGLTLDGSASVLFVTLTRVNDRQLSVYSEAHQPLCQTLTNAHVG